MALAPQSPMGGPSPRAWGEPAGPGAWPDRWRTIPTGVGRTQEDYAAEALAADHPHGRGENRAGFGASEASSGPSPRAWGERMAHAPASRMLRTIPTGVGRTASMRPCGCRQTDHPHGRGENLRQADPEQFKDGPSPRAWGERPLLLVAHVVIRTIPTGVGRTWRYPGNSRSAPDHPHGRGENRHRGGHRRTKTGPSPRAWGEPPGRAGAGRCSRTIPTGVGRTLPLQGFTNAYEAILRLSDGPKKAYFASLSTARPPATNHFYSPPYAGPPRMSQSETLGSWYHWR